MIPAEWNTHMIEHRYAGGCFVFLREVPEHPNYVKLVDFNTSGKCNKVWTAHREMLKASHMNIDTETKQQVAELRDRIAKGEDCIHNGFVVAKGGKA